MHMTCKEEDGSGKGTPLVYLGCKQTQNKHEDYHYTLKLMDKKNKIFPFTGITAANLC